MTKMRGRNVQPFERRASKHIVQLLLGQPHGFHVAAQLQITQRKRIIRTHADAIGALQLQHIMQQISIMGDAVNPEFTEIRATATKSGRQRNPCSNRPSVVKNDPPAWLNITLKLGSRSKTPPKTNELAARDVSAGIPTSQGSQYFSI